jgi:glycosyltransferase involved in cell wall biosynthesis
MHIGIVSPCSSGPLADLLFDSEGIDLGCGVHFMATLIRALINRGHRVSVITLSPEVRNRQILEGRNLNFYVNPMRTQKRMRDLFKVERESLRECILLARPDILHAHWTYEFALASFETGMPTLLTSHDNAFQQLRFSKDLYRLGRLYMQIRAIRKARFMTAVSPYLAKSLRWLFKPEIAVIPNPVDVSQTAESIFDRPAGPVKIATVLNGWGNRKNPKAAIIAFGLLRLEYPDTELFMYGHDYEEGGLASQWASTKGLCQNIHFRGFLSPYQLRTELSMMSILLHPALEESFGMAVTEAMALGLSVVAGTGSGGVPWVLDNGQAGFLTDVRDPGKIAQTLLACITQAEDRKRRQIHAYNRVVGLFSAGSIAEQYEKIYEKILLSQGN